MATIAPIAPHFGAIVVNRGDLASVPGRWSSDRLPGGARCSGLWPGALGPAFGLALAADPPGPATWHAGGHKNPAN